MTCDFFGGKTNCVWLGKRWGRVVIRSYTYVLNIVSDNPKLIFRKGNRHQSGEQALHHQDPQGQDENGLAASTGSLVNRSVSVTPGFAKQGWWQTTERQLTVAIARQRVDHKRFSSFSASVQRQANNQQQVGLEWLTRQSLMQKF